MAEALNVKPKSECRWDVVSLGEVMLRLDPGEGRVHTTRTFQVWEGGGEYNVARGLKRCFGLEAAVVTALADNPVGRLVQDLIYQGGVDQSHVLWRKYDGVGRETRNGLNFTERGFGIRGALGCSDRGHTAASQLRPGAIDWERVFGRDGALDHLPEVRNVQLRVVLVQPFDLEAEAGREVLLVPDHHVHQLSKLAVDFARARVAAD